VRPRTPRRQPYSTISVLERLLTSYGSDVHVTTFGCSDADIKKLSRSKAIRSGHRGVLRRHEVAALLASSDVFLDMSMYQAFGRTALEAMACGCTAIVPRNGGVWEFLEDGVNGIAVDTFDREDVYRALSALVGDHDRVAALRVAARATGSRYSVLAASISEYLLFDHQYRNRFRTGDALRDRAPSAVST
jgi:glycosyltransferase involved in cell wall biosynthesis